MSFKAKKTALFVGLCFLGMVSAQQASAATESVASVQQTKQVSGHVADSQGPLIGATVMEKGTTNGTVTDFEGNFSLNVSPGATLVVSYVGYESQEVKAADGMRVNLKEDGHVVNEVVVIGYGTQRREAVTGSVANIGGEKLNQVAASNAAQALQGRVAGVLMTQTSSKPGAEMQVRIRGQRSLTASNDPLIVLDGIPFMGALSDINPTDIKSMDILKDASATAIYGSRGANGVIIITTVKGTQGSPAKVTYNGYVSFRSVFKKYPMMDGPTFSKFRQYAGKYQNSLDESDNINTDWQDLYYQTGVSHNHDISVAGGTNGGSYSFGAGYYKDESVVPTEGYQRISVRGNFDQKVGEYFRFGLSTNNSYRMTEGVNNMYNILSSTPISSPYDENGNLKRYNALPADDQPVVTKETVERDKDVWLSENKGFGSYNTLFAEVKCPQVSTIRMPMPSTVPASVRTRPVTGLLRTCSLTIVSLLRSTMSMLWPCILPSRQDMSLQVLLPTVSLLTISSTMHSTRLQVPMSTSIITTTGRAGSFPGWLVPCTLMIISICSLLPYVQMPLLCWLKVTSGIPIPLSALVGTLPVRASWRM